MCWKWRYSCGHTANIECDAPKRDLNDPEDDDLAYACDGFPKNYTNVDAPCMKCLIGKTDKVDEPKTNGNTTTNTTQNHNGRGNNTWGAEHMAAGWINLTHLGTWPWDKDWMVTAAGKKYNEEGVIVDDPVSKIELTMMVVRNETFEFDFDAKYDDFTDNLEAISNHPAYGSISAYMVFVQPSDPLVLAAIKQEGSAYRALPATPPILSPASSRTSSASSLSTLASNEAPSADRADIANPDDEVDTPNTQYTFDNDVGHTDEPATNGPDSPQTVHEKLQAESEKVTGFADKTDRSMT